MARDRKSRTLKPKGCDLLATRFSLRGPTLQGQLSGLAGETLRLSTGFNPIREKLGVNQDEQVGSINMICLEDKLGGKDGRSTAERRKPKLRKGNVTRKS